MILLLGKTGSGKSTLAKKLLDRFPRRVAFDPLCEYRQGVIYTDLETFAEHIKPFADNDRSCEFVCRFQADTLERTEAMYHTAARILWEVKNVCLLLEEAEQYLSSYDGDNPINYLISFGRHRRISLIGIGRRPVELSIKLRAQCTTVVSFSQNEPRDIAYLSQWGFDAEELLKLEGHNFVYIGENPNALLETSKTPGNGNGVQNHLPLRSNVIVSGSRN